MGKSVESRLESLEAAALMKGATILWCSWKMTEGGDKLLTAKHGESVYTQKPDETEEAFRARVSGEVAGRPPYPAFVWLSAVDQAI